VKKTPFSVLVDKAGVIVWTGNPNERKLEQDIEYLLNDQPILINLEQTLCEEDAKAIKIPAEQFQAAIWKFLESAKALVEENFTQL